MSRVAAGRDEGNGLVLDPKQVSNDLVPSLEVPTIKIVVSTSSSILDDVFAVPEEIETSLTVFPSKRGGKNAAYCGHIFNFFHQSSKTIKWRCKNRKNLRCPAVLTTAVDFTFVVVTPTHNHPPDHDKVRSTVLTRTIYDASLVNPDKKPAELVEQFLSANPCTSALPMIASMRQTIWHHRKRNGALTDTKHLEGAEPISKPVITAGVNFGTVLRSTTEGDVRLAQVYSKNLKKRRSSEPCNEDAKGDSLLLGKANCIKSRSTKIFSVALTTSSEGSTDALHATATVSTREQRLQKRRSRELKSQGLPNTPRFSTSTEDVKCQIKSMSNLSGLLNENHSNANQPELREPADATQISAIMAGSDNEMSESKLTAKEDGNGNLPAIRPGTTKEFAK
ncbi:hypothetical protein QR680_000207 [Steinernema hermaphroditum]|uniref:FLYWCH-type domain-containing protein n=1 Tax=Steinernema hermaphroditum TaxID=289476 RepID=A0AA39GTS9_9BILA|nr:hypothetical protein QR680_000207 [Steinernema hermaphroditum]